MSASLSYDNFRKCSRRKLSFGRRVHLQGIRDKYVYEGHRVKVTRSKIGSSERSARIRGGLSVIARRILSVYLSVCPYIPVFCPDK